MTQCFSVRVCASWLTCQTPASIEQVYSIPAQSRRCHMLSGGVRALGRPGLINLLLWGPVIAFMAECWRDWFSDQSCPCVCVRKTTVSGENTHTGTGGSMLIVSLEWWNATEIWLDHLFLLLSLFISFFHRSSSLQYFTRLSVLHLFSRHNSSTIFHLVLCITQSCSYTLFLPSPSLDESNERGLPDLQLLSSFTETMSLTQETVLHQDSSVLHVSGF